MAIKCSASRNTNLKLFPLWIIIVWITFLNKCSYNQCWVVTLLIFWLILPFCMLFPPFISVCATTTGAVLDRIFIFVVSNPSILPIWPLLINCVVITNGGGARSLEQPISTNSVPRDFFPRVAIGCRLLGGVLIGGYMRWFSVNTCRRYGIWYYL